MNPFTKSTRLCFATVIALVWSVSSRAEVWQSRELNCAITLPLESGWTRVSPPADMVKIAIHSADRTKIISVSVSEIDRELSEERFVERFKNRWFEHGTGKGRTEERIQVDGRSAYRLKDIANLAGKEMHRADTVVIERGKLYQIDAIGVGADPMNDSAVLNCVNSFRFLTQMASSVNKPLPVERTDKLPERVADITFAVLIGLIAIFGVVKIVKKRR